MLWAQHTQVCTPCPDFQRWMEVLSNNRRIYNAYNDSVFMQRDHNAWINLIRRRALRNRQLFQSNKTAINTITQYFSQDSSLIEDDAYDKFFHAVRWLRAQETSDPFLNLAFDRILEQYYKTCADSMSHIPIINWYMGMDYYSMFNLDRDTATLRKSYVHFIKNLKETRPEMPDYEYSRQMAYNNLTRTVWVSYDMEPIDSLWKRYHEALEEMKRPGIKQILGSKTYRNQAHRLAMVPELIARNIYLKDSTLPDKQRADSLIQTIVDRNMGKEIIETSTLERVILMRQRLGQLSNNNALIIYSKIYQERKKAIGNKRLENIELNNLLTSALNMFYLVDIANMPAKKKQHMVRSLYRDVIRFVKQRENTQKQYNNQNLLGTLATYERAIKYLTEKERIKLFNMLIVNMQLHTYAHSVYVAKISKLLTENIISKQPSLLIGVNGCQTMADVMLQRKELIDLAYHGALYHDIGKCAIAPVVNDDYRPLLDDEFALISRHPDYARRYVRIMPSLAKYLDIALGHHRWYDGRGGYPTSFDNTKSPIRNLIDIVTIADCIQAATEKVGRNYKSRLEFDEVMQELRDQSGTRYNPAIVKFIDSHPDVSRKMKHQIEQGWLTIYYRIFQRYFH